eukprot:scaffold12420_cov137-Skeletonema_marinoi.AAC.2
MASILLNLTHPPRPADYHEEATQMMNYSYLPLLMQELVSSLQLASLFAQQQPLTALRLGVFWHLPEPGSYQSPHPHQQLS